MPYIPPMASLTITTKGQVTLRKELLEHMGVAPGQKVSVEKLPNGRIQVSAAPRGKISDVFGMLENNGQHFTIEELNDVIADAWAGKR